MKQSKVIQISVFGILFIISLIVWNYMLVGRNNKGVTETQQPTLPLLTVSADGKNINQLHGYQGSVDASLIRDSITPIYENQVKVILTHGSDKISVVSYKIYDTDNKTVLGNGDTAFHKEKGKRTANIQIKERLENGKTYLMELSVKKDDQTIRYFTRVIYGTSFHLKECLNFAQKFHNAALTEGNTEFISQFLETKEGTTSNNLASVDLSSTQEAVSYASLKPQVESIYPATVKEISENVTSIELRYILSAENSDGTKQYYQATEYFRVRYAKDRMYLLNYERNMEAYMRYDTIDRSNNRILLGIGNSQKQLISQKGGKKAAFVVQDELWYYDYQKSNMYKVFSFEGEDYRDSRSNYQKHDIQIMKMKSNGDISFVVYGYMNRGKHEGENGISVYQFTASDQKIEELAFIPTQIQYEMMKNDIKKGAFLSDNNEFYFYLDGAVYQVDMKSKKSSVLAKNITDDMTVISDSGMLALNQSKNKMKIMDLSTQKSEVITCDKDQVLRPIGFIEKDFIYGIGDKDKVVRNKDGSYMYPLNNVYIRSNKKIVKEYGENGTYITDTSVDGTAISLTHSKQSGKSYKKVNVSYIRYKDKQANKVVLEYGYTGNRLNQLYLGFPDNVYIQTRPNYLSTNVEEQDDETKIKFASNDNKYNDAYVYTGGKLSGIYSNMKEAVKVAKQGGGVVVNYHQMYLWEKGIAQNYGKASNIPMVKAKSKDETDIACILMMAQSDGIKISYDKIKKMSGSTYDKLFKVFNKRAVNYSDCSMEDLVYVISKGRSFMAQRKNGTYVVVMSYNQTDLRYYDPVSGKSVKANRSKLESEFKQAGSVYYGYAN